MKKRALGPLFRSALDCVGARGRRAIRQLLHLVLPVAALWSCAPLSAATLSPAPAEHPVDWSTSPLDLDLRGFDGERFRFKCPPGRPAAGQVIGSGPYTDGSSICAAGVHAGAIRAAAGGLVTIEMRPGQAHYPASLSHNVQSASYDQLWSGSFLVILSNTAEVPP